tara:strand:+ start:54071 stop:55243 length:1173 start_codon:yes stop_codon:yes gene_type:complete
MASTFKALLGDDVVNTRTLLHEAIPITGTIVSGTYNVGTTENNIKNFSHGMFQSVYDYPFLSSSSNHIFDVTFGISSNASSSVNTQNAKKMNVYNQMAQVLMGYTTGSQIRKFDSDGTLDDQGSGIMDHCFFLNFSRLLTKDEVKKGQFRLTMQTSGALPAGSPVHGATEGTQLVFGDYDSTNEYRTSPAGDYGLIFSSSADASTNSLSCGLIFYQAGVVVLTSSIFSPLGVSGSGVPYADGGLLNYGEMYNGSYFGMNPNIFGSGSTNTSAKPHGGPMKTAITGATIQQLANGFRHRIQNVTFNNTIELNSAIYFCRINHNEYNYSSNPTYVSGSKLVVKNNVNDLPISYITTVGLYSSDNELLAVAKLSEPIRKDPNTELTLRVRLDY